MNRNLNPKTSKALL